MENRNKIKSIKGGPSILKVIQMDTSPQVFLLPSLGDIGRRDFCLLSDIMGLNGALNVVVTVPQSTFESSSVLSLFRNGALLMQNNPQTLL